MARVAILDDSEDVLELFKVILEGGDHFVSYSDPHQFLRDFRPGDFALILLDMSMPDIDGYEVFRRVREKDKRVPICAVTGHAQPAQIQKALRAGFCDYFVKPIIEIDRFREKVYSHIGKCSNPPYNS